MAFHIILPEQGEHLLLWYFVGHTTRLNRLTVGLEILAPLLESMTGTIDSLEITHISIQYQRFPCSQIVQPPAPAHHRLQILIRQTLIEHRQVIAEVQECLHRIALRQCSATYMIHITIWHTDDSSSTDSQSPTEVYLLIMRKKPSVESTGLPIVLRANQQCSASRPMAVRLIIILPVITLHRFKNTASTEGWQAAMS